MKFFIYMTCLSSPLIAQANLLTEAPVLLQCHCSDTIKTTLLSIKQGFEHLKNDEDSSALPIFLEALSNYKANSSFETLPLKAIALLGYILCLDRADRMDDLYRDLGHSFINIGQYLVDNAKEINTLSQSYIDTAQQLLANNDDDEELSFDLSNEDLIILADKCKNEPLKMLLLAMSED
jgi:hypothetical protein